MSFFKSLLRESVFETPVGEPVVTVTGTKTIVSGPNWYGRTSMKVRNGITIMAYREATNHFENDFDIIKVMFSTDYGETWTAPNTYVDGSTVVGMPSFPDGGSGDPEGAGEPWLYLMPNGKLVIHMWKSNYGVTNNGTYQIESTDGGKTWTAPALVNFQYQGSTHPNNLNIFATDDDFVLDGIVYTGAREYQSANSQLTALRSWFLKTEDNGTTWELISLLSNFGDVSNEYGMTYVGNNEIVAMMREFVTICYQTRSYNLGLTWEPLTEVSALYGVMSRQRINTTAQLKLKYNYWNDPILICHGYEHISPGNSHPRQIAVWISKDRGLTWSNPFYMDVAGYDGGYGSMIYNPNTNEYVYTCYYAAIDDTDLNDGVVKQYNFTLTFE